ncbi:esterase [Thiosulfatimonas sediminis]|uniref:Esterase n=1 Tax=Thiosulfatimonas sediminis TaxID=2675054 RepID=A0A6F8PVQ2_9GAMM|nr:alpha/beta hydrolase [Thiosulfatimonas sediminis]BBP46050.1 esterase [Thiosulfatimonas sediminis]
MRLKSLIYAIPLFLSGCSGVDVLNQLAEQDRVEVRENLVFDAQTGLTLDVYRPVEMADKPYPVIVFYWGGRWQEGDKSMYQFVGREFAKRGIVTVIPNYRLWPQVGYQGFLKDSAKAVEWTERSIAEFSGDQQRIFLMGHSAGAYNALMLGLNTPFLAHSQRRLAGVIGISGPYDFLPFSSEDLPQIFAPEANFEQTQPIHWVDGKNSPALLIHSLDDDIVFPKNTRNLAQKISESGGEVETLYIKSLSHPLMIGVVSNILSWKAPIADKIEGFVKQMPAVDVELSAAEEAMPTESLPNSADYSSTSK